MSFLSLLRWGRALVPLCLLWPQYFWRVLAGCCVECLLAWLYLMFVIKLELCIFGKKTREGLPLWLSGQESTCQRRRHRLNPWSWKILPASEHLSRAAQLPSPCSRELPLRSAHTAPGEQPRQLQLEKSLCSSEDPAPPQTDNKTYEN